MLNSIFNLFKPESELNNNKVSPRPLEMRTVYGSTASTIANCNRFHAPLSEKAQLTKHKKILEKQGRYASVEEIRLDKNTLLVGFGQEQSGEFGFYFSFESYYASKEWNGLKKHAAAKKTSLICYQPKHDDVLCLKLTRLGDSKVCSYLINRKMIEIHPTRGLMVSPPAALADESSCNEQRRNILKK